MDKLEEYSDVMNRLVAEAIACTPEEWSHGKLSIEADGVRINYKLKNDSDPGAASISEKLRDLIDELYVRMDRHGDTWVGAVIDFQLDGDRVKLQTSFQYSQVATPTPSTKKPWWKFGGGRA